MRCARITMLGFVAFLPTGLFGCAAPQDSADDHAARRSVSGKGRPARMPIGAEAAMKRWQRALSRRDWEGALACCAPDVRKAADRYATREEFFQKVVPVEKITAVPEFRRYSGVRKRSGYQSYASFVRLVDVEDRPVVSWTWWAETKGLGWQITFSTTPLEEWIESETARRIAERKDREAALARLAPKLEHVRTKLTPVGERFVVHEPILMRLELINGGTAELIYDDQQVDVNDPLEVTDSAGIEIPYAQSGAQTTGAYRKLGPGESVVLFDEFDLASEYAIAEPGRYRIRFRGRGLSVGAVYRLAKSGYVNAPNPWPSNVVEIEVAEK